MNEWVSSRSAEDQVRRRSSAEMPVGFEADQELPVGGGISSRQGSTPRAYASLKMFLIETLLWPRSTVLT